jgi:hypothetical protein
MSLIWVGQDCGSSNLITRAKGSPGIHHNGGNVGPGLGQAGGAAACVRPVRGPIGAKRTLPTVSVAPKVSKMVA